MLKKVLKRAGLVLGVAVAAAASLALYVDIRGIPHYPRPTTDPRVVEVTPARVEQGAKLVGMLCAGCHENGETHRFTGKLMADLPPERPPTPDAAAA